MPSLDELRLRVVPGDGVVLRVPGITAIAFPAGEQHQALVTAFLDAARTAAGQPDAGRKVTRAAAGLLAAADDAPPLGLVGTDAEGLAVLLHGDVEFAYKDPSGADVVLSGRDAATWLDRLVAEVPGQWSLARDGAGAADEWSDLQAGVARGDGVATGAAAPAATPAPTTEPEPEPEAMAEPEPEPEADAEPTPAPEVDEAPAPEPEPEPAPMPEPEVAPPPPSVETAAPVPAADFVAVSLLEPEDDEPARPPLPVAGSDEPLPPDPEDEGVVHCHGVMCARGHFNDPNSPFCASCGISMVQQTHNLVEGPRPPLGVLVLDDGSTYVVDRDIVIGREPATDPAVADGSTRGITLPDPERSISRVHAKVTLVDWEVRVADAGSANGTFVAGRTATEWTPVTPAAPAVLTAGMHVLVGSRVLSFDSHRRS